MKRTVLPCLLAISLLATGCHIRGGEPDRDDLFDAVQDQLEHTNDRGGIKINMGNAGAFQNISFDLKLHTLTKHGCTGGNYAYTCKISMMVSYPPVKETPEMIEGEVMVFDGPGGWRVIE